MSETAVNGNSSEDNWQNADELLSRFDKNKDGALDLGEFQELCLELFGTDEIDRHGDKLVDIFQALDANSDGFLDDYEWQTCYDNWLKVVIKPVNIFLIVDVQNDFIDGTLALRNLGLGQDAADIVGPINTLITDCHWDKIIYSLDWHPPNHIGFYDNLHLRELHPDSKVKKEDAKVFDTVLFSKPKREQKLWPIHCVFDSWGAQLHKDLIIAPNSIQIKKGQDPEVDSYSTFFDNNLEKATELPQILEQLGATDIYMCGLAFDVCVCSSSLDGLRLNYRVALIENCCRGVDPVQMAGAKKKITERGGLILQLEQVKAHVEGKTRSLVMALQGAKALAKRRSLL
ncbi:nicotinamidase-like [Phymastichus coffea]|uniref:nicotinamidase-like n=1 Tax=Phymastichus coffea TaxID=108790 RepID=UPI00273C2FB3|nr:nicotinamidase-like [Phymastichus coffea]XP_058797424.1 nicotinamidase-like [Phymastichus coffea]XP_058797425.1 nicotinamidase-like [Phymastichus coffea]XP_058797426.1 nicotinamidase-like [Phymastichus coffea]